MTKKGKENQKRINEIRGDLSEAFVEDLLAILIDEDKIQNFRKATQEEDWKQRVDYVVVSTSSKKIGIQVKSSDYGAMKFKREEQTRFVQRNYPVIAFVPDWLAKKPHEAQRLIRELNHFELSLKREIEARI